MKKKLAGIVIFSILALGLVACGGNTDEETTTEPAAETEAAESESVEEAPYTFENGVFTCKTFRVTVPDGWCMGSNADAECVTFLNAASEDDYDVFTNASIEIKVAAYAYQPSDASVTKDSSIENDKQFFKDDLVITDYSADIYSGSLLTGSSFAYSGCTNAYYIMDTWKDGTDDCSIAKIKTAYYTAEEKAALDEIVASIVYTPGGDEEQAAVPADAETFLDEEYFSIELPEGWYLDPDRSPNEIKLKCTRMEQGYVTVDAYTDSCPAEEWAEKYNGNFGGGYTVETCEYNGATYKCVNPDSLSILVADASAEGVTVHVKTMFCMLDSIEDLMEGITIK